MLMLLSCLNVISLLIAMPLSQGNEIDLITASAELHPDTWTDKFGLRASASAAINGDNATGRCGGVHSVNYASTADTSRNSLKYLVITMNRAEYISYVKLHLRDGYIRYSWQNGLTVGVSNSKDINSVTQCGDQYNPTVGQSPAFICSHYARYIWIVLKDNPRPLQVCEVRAYRGTMNLMNLTAPGLTLLSHGSLTLSGYTATADKSVDGNSAIGNSGGGSRFANCAINGRKGVDDIQYLRISLSHTQFVLFIRLHFRDSIKRYRSQNGLLVSVGTSAIATARRNQCGSSYKASQGQSPVFICNTNASYVWLTLRSYQWLQVCEVEVYADVRCNAPPNLINGNYRLTNRSVRGSLTVLCDQGYAATSLEQVICKRSGNWSRSFPTCQKDFSCSSCHENALCNSKSRHCNCKPGYFGDGKQCCAEDLRERTAITGESALLSCESNCNVPFDRVVWYFNSLPVRFADSRFGVARGGMLLYIQNVSKGEAGQYTCEIHNGKSVFKRYTNLQLIEKNSCGSQANSLCSSDCGKSCARKPFVARGDLTHAGQFPWQAMLCTGTHGHHCGGVLVSDDCIVTAAQCVISQGVFIKNIMVCVGRQCGNCSETDVEGNPQCFKPKSIDIHPNYSRSTLDNDIALIKLPKPVSCHCNSVLPICLPNETRDGPYMRSQIEGIVTGWGRVNSSVSRSTCLRKGNVRLVSRSTCSNLYPHYSITTSMMCATDYNGACEGDSGGPLVIKNRHFGGRYVLAGIVSWGVGCGHANRLGVYTSVLDHVDWIKKTCVINS